MDGAVGISGDHGGAVRLTGASAVDWTQRAQPGAVLCYHIGFGLGGTTEESNEALHRLVAQGYLYLKQARAAAGAGFHYLAERSSRPWGQPIKGWRP